MSEPKRLHPITSILNSFKILKELIIPFFAFVVFGSKGINIDYFPLIAGVAVLIIIFISGFLSWLRFTYRMEDEELRIEYGLFVRKKRYIPFERIQSIDLSEGIFHRLFHLVKLKVETAGGSGAADAEAVLTAISKDEAIAIQEILQRVKNHEHIEGEEEKLKENILYKISFKELVILASTSGGVGVVISAIAAFFAQFDELIPYERLFQGLEDFISNGIIFVSIIVFFAFLVVWIAAMIAMMIKYADFTLKKVNDDLIITRGILEKRQITIPLNRIQGIRVSENLLRQPLGYASVFIESAGGSISNTESAKVNILPVIKKDRIRDIIEPNLEGFLLNKEMAPAPKRALRRYILRGWFWVIPISAALIFFFKQWGIVSLILLPLSACWSYLKYRDAGWSQDSNQLALSYRGLIKNTVYMQKNKVQSLSVKESFFQRKRSLATVEATVMSGVGGAGGSVVDLEKEDVLTMYNWYSKY